MTTLSGKIALVTGSTSGIGYAIAKELALQGAKVYIHGRSQDKVNHAVAQLKTETKGQLSGVVADLSQAEGAKALIAQLPKVDVLVNNLGIFEVMPFFEISDEDWTRFFEVNVMSGVRLTRHYFAQMLAQNWGRVIFIASESGIQTPVEMIHYGVTKAAQISMVTGLAEMTKGTQVTVNSVLPGPTKTEGVETFVRNLADDQNSAFETLETNFFKEHRAASLLQRFIRPEEIANLVAYISSPSSAATNGASMRADGGMLKG